MVDINYLNDDIKICYDNEYIIKFVDFVFDKLDVKDKNFSMVFVDSQKIKELNKIFRNKDSSTDVLSFCFSEDKDNVGSFDKDNLGEIYISPEDVRDNAKEFGLPIEEEILRVILHGMLHLLGYEHDDNCTLNEFTSLDNDSQVKMFAVQEKILKDFLLNA